MTTEATGFPHQVPGFPVPHEYLLYYLSLVRDNLPATNVHHESGTGDEQVVDGKNDIGYENGRYYDVERGRIIRGSV